MRLPTGRRRRAWRPEVAGDVHAIAHQVIVGLADYIAEVNADAVFDAALGRDAGVALDHRILDFDGATHRVDNAAKLNEGSIAGALDHAPVVDRDRGVDQMAPQRPQPRQRPLFVRASEPAEADHVGAENRRELPRFVHGAP